MPARKWLMWTFTGGTGLKNPAKKQKIYAGLKPWKPPKKIWKRKKKILWKEKDTFLQKREGSSHVCEICGKFIPEPLAYCFAHKLDKWQYPEFRLDVNNICLVCSLECHQKVDELCKWNAFSIKENLLVWVPVLVNMI
jgi:hypothetical protein